MSPAAAAPARGARRDAGGTLPVHLVRGDDAALVSQAARELIDRLLEGREAALVVEEHGISDELDVGSVVDACTTPPFLVDRRIVVVRDAGRLTAADAGRIATMLEHPIDAVHLVLVAGGGALSPALVKAVAGGEVLDASAGRGRDRSRWLTEQIRRGPVRLDAAAAHGLETHLGEDMGRLAGLLETLAAAYGPGATVSLAELGPFLGEAGAVPPWELTDAIDAGDAPGALKALHRMLAAGGRPPPVVLATLHTHFSNMLRLDGAGASTGDDAAAVLGARSAFVAKKALEQGRRLGGERVGQAIVLLADADLDLKGQTALPGEMVLEILVARLARLGRTRVSGTGGPRPSRRAPGGTT